MTTALYDTVDLFAGPGGWDISARAMGLRTVGIEKDDAACATRREAGLLTLKTDVTSVHPADFRGVPGLIGSPPCPTFSPAGKGAGRRAIPDVIAALSAVGNGAWPDEFVELDEITRLVLQPAHWVRLMRPEWVALEQVTPVLPIWEATARFMQWLGYSVATGVLSAEQYGVPQTRKRAILIASRVGEVSLPAPTNRKYRKGVARDEGDPSLLPWVSMADALGWGMTARPSMTVTAGGGKTGGAEPFGNAARKGMQREADAGRWAGQARNSGPGAARAPRTIDEPSYTIRAHGSGSHPAGVEWVMNAAGRTGLAPRRVDEPSATITGKGTAWLSPAERRVAVAEAAVLQSFPADYPWQGGKTKQYEQVGNAIPPLLAAHVLSAATGLALPNINQQEAAA